MGHKLWDIVWGTPPHFPHITIGVYIYRVIYKAGFFVCGSVVCIAKRLIEKHQTPLNESFVFL